METRTLGKINLKIKITVYIMAVILIIGTGIYLLLRFDRIRSLNSLQKIGDLELYVMDYDSDYKFDEFLEKGADSFEVLNMFLKFNLVSMGNTRIEDSEACSVFSAFDERGNRIFGRNLDISGLHPGLLLYTSPKGAYSSISMVEMTVLGYGENPELFSDWNPFQTMFMRRALLKAPYMPRDGMNEWGLAVATLDVPYSAPNVDDKRVTIGRWQALRLMLDYAKNVDEAAALLEKYNCFDGSVHYFISDASGASALIESFNGRMQITRNTEDYMAAANFIVSDPSQHGGGHDRYDLINDVLKKTGGRVAESDAMGILKSVSGSTAWSIVYNQSTGQICIAFGKDYNNVREFVFDLKNNRI